MVARTCNRPDKGYSLSFVLSPSISFLSRFISPLDNIDELFEPSILFGYSIPTLNTTFAILSIVKYIKKDL